ncbi:hypothetical protein ACEWY4_024477 [Coilia grayii]|uniref:CCHC-type domain-containing protein n=1 Tax=Coilia grayii TaxID=363190 RepID=A0ABD1J0J1_9TELE
MPMRRAAFFLSLRDGGFDVLFLQECHVGGEEDVRALQEGWTGGPSVWGGGNVRADGVGILFRGWDFTMHVVWEVVAGRVLCVDAGWRGVQLRLIYVYAPCVPGERRRVFAEVAPLLHTSRLVVLGGDFNSSLDTAPSGDLGGLVGGLPLVDAFRVAGDGSPGFTWRNSRGQASRLDYLFVSAGVGVRGFVLQPLWLSDHCLIGAQLDVGEQQRRRSRGPWRFNASFLGDPSFCRVFRQLYAGWRALRPMYSSVCAWWEGVKARIATFCSEWGREKVRDARRMVERWAAELRGLWGAGSAPSAAQTERMRLLRSHLRDFYMAEARALVGLGGGSRWAPEEGPSKAFYASLRQRRSRTCLGTLRGPAGLVTEPGEVMEVARSFYADLFAQQDTDPFTMADGGGGVGPAHVVRLKNSVRVLVAADASPDQKARFGRVFLVVSVLRELFSLDPEEIFCFQDFSSAGFADVTFRDLRVCQRFVAAWEEKKGNHLLGGLVLRPLHHQDVVQLVLHMYNPYVQDADVEAFLARHVVFVKGGTRLKDNFGIWTGKRRYVVRLRPDPARLGEFIHPPGSFSIGADRGFLTYPGQPLYCRRCGGLGHTKAACSGSRCRFCGGEGHAADRCQAPRQCSLCGSEGHLFRACPGRSRTYADAARPQRLEEEVVVADAAVVSEAANAVAEGPHGLVAAQGPPPQVISGGALPALPVEVPGLPVNVPAEAPPGGVEEVSAVPEVTELLALSSWGDSVDPAPCGLLDCSWGPETVELLQSAGPVAPPDGPVDLLAALGEDMELEPGRVASPKRPAGSSDEELARLRRETKREKREGSRAAPEGPPPGPAAVREAPGSLPEPVPAAGDGSGRVEDDRADPPSGWSGDLLVVPDTPDEPLRARDAALAGEAAGQGSAGGVSHGSAVSPRPEDLTV